MRSLLLALALVSGTAIACPNLSGEYAVCRSKNNISIEGTNLVVSQSMNYGTHVYTFSVLPDGVNERVTETFEASGQPVHRTWVSETGVKFNAVVTAKCEGNSLKVDSVITSDGMNWKSDVSVIRKIDNKLVTTSKGKVVVMPFTDTLTCY